MRMKSYVGGRGGFAKSVRTFLFIYRQKIELQEWVKKKFSAAPKNMTSLSCAHIHANDLIHLAVFDGLKKV